MAQVRDVFLSVCSGGKERGANSHRSANGQGQAAHHRVLSFLGCIADVGGLLCAGIVGELSVGGHCYTMVWFLCVMLEMTGVPVW